MTPDYLIGIGLGCANGPAALAVLERTRAGNAPASYGVSHLQRWPAGYGYAEVAREVGALVRGLPCRPARLLLDAALGSSVVQIFRRERVGLLLPAVVATDAAATTWGPDGVTVPANEVASAVLALFQEDRLRFGPVPEEVTVRRGLKAFSEKAGPLGRLAQWVLGADPGDELVLAVALAAWAGEKASRRLVVG